jgi:hypothetical protein
LLAKEAIDLANQAYKDAEKHYNTAVSMVKMVLLYRQMN